MARERMKPLQQQQAVDEDESLDRAEKAMLNLLIRRANNDSWITTKSLGDIAKQLGECLRTARATLKRLVQKGRVLRLDVDSAGDRIRYEGGFYETTTVEIVDSVRGSGALPISAAPPSQNLPRSLPSGSASSLPTHLPSGGVSFDERSGTGSGEETSEVERVWQLWQHYVPAYHAARDVDPPAMTDKDHAAAAALLAAYGLRRTKELLTEYFASRSWGRTGHLQGLARAAKENPGAFDVRTLAEQPERAPRPQRELRIVETVRYRPAAWGPPTTPPPLPTPRSVAPEQPAASPDLRLQLAASLKQVGKGVKAAAEEPPPPPSSRREAAKAPLGPPRSPEEASRIALEMAAQERRELAVTQHTTGPSIRSARGSPANESGQQAGAG